MIIWTNHQSKSQIHNTTKYLKIWSSIFPIFLMTTKRSLSSSGTAHSPKQMGALHRIALKPIPQTVETT